MFEFSLDDLLDGDEIHFSPPNPVVGIGSICLEQLSMKATGKRSFDELSDERMTQSTIKKPCLGRSSPLKKPLTLASTSFETTIALEKLHASISGHIQLFEAYVVDFDPSIFHWRITNMCAGSYLQFSVQIFENGNTEPMQYSIEVQFQSGDYDLFQYTFEQLVAAVQVYPAIPISAVPVLSAAEKFAFYSSSKNKEIIRDSSGILLRRSKDVGTFEHEQKCFEAVTVICSMVENCRDVREMSTLYDAFLVPHALMRTFASLYPAKGPNSLWICAYALRSLCVLVDLDQRYADVISRHDACPVLMQYLTAVCSGVNDFDKCRQEDEMRVMRPYAEQLQSRMKCSSKPAVCSSNNHTTFASVHNETYPYAPTSTAVAAAVAAAVIAASTPTASKKTHDSPLRWHQQQDTLCHSLSTRYLGKVA